MWQLENFGGKDNIFSVGLQLLHWLWLWLCKASFASSCQMLAVKYEYCLTESAFANTQVIHTHTDTHTLTHTQLCKLNIEQGDLCLVCD